DPVYVGLGVCSHKADVLETAVFSNVKLEARSAGARGNQGPSHISVYDLKTNSTSILYEADRHFEASNWSPDGKYLMLNSGGNLYRLAVDRASGAAPVKIELGNIIGCNNDHGISPDGKMLAISAQMNQQKS